MLEIIGVGAAALVAVAILGKMWIGSMQDLKGRVITSENKILAIEKTINGGFERNEKRHDELMASIQGVRDRVDKLRER